MLQFLMPIAEQIWNGEVGMVEEQKHWVLVEKSQN